ncbi:MAG: AbrB/MazE/SpoVT family DNA-binding domain-containing protein [Terriglobia bacterium]
MGKHLGLRIPKSVAQDAQLQEGDPIAVTIASHGNLVVKAARRRYNGKHLVSLINAKNCHAETDWSRPTGKEIW